MALNQFLVGAAGDKLAIIGVRKLAAPITRAEAVNLAAWLVCMAETIGVMDGVQPGEVTADFQRELAEARAS